MEINSFTKLVRIAKGFAAESMPSTSFMVRDHSRINRRTQTKNAVKPYKKRKFFPLGTQGAR